MDRVRARLVVEQDWLEPCGGVSASLLTELAHCAGLRAIDAARTTPCRVVESRTDSFSPGSGDQLLADESRPRRLGRSGLRRGSEEWVT